MLNITIYGPGCAKCQETERRVRHAVEQSRIQATVRKATDFAEMAKAGVLMTPAVAFNGVVKLSGRIPREDEISPWLHGN
ncbi:MAG: thioredoxin family protein [Terriglobales bacterium]